MLLLRTLSPSKREHDYDTFISGLLGGYIVFGRGRQGSVNQQIVIYVFARVVLAIAKIAVLPGTQTGNLASSMKSKSRFVLTPQVAERVRENAWPVFASMSWAAVMYVFRKHPETIQPSLRSSMRYIYVDSDSWNGLKTLLWHNT